MRLRRRTAAILLAALAVTGLTAPPASATQQQICGNGGTGYCLNDWGGGGNGNPVKMYNGGNSNEDFFFQTENECYKGGLDGWVHWVTSTAMGDATDCPFTHASLDKTYWNDNVGEVQYANGWCAATNATAGAILGQCVEGGTPANGVIMVETPCGSNYLIDRYWTDRQGGSIFSLQSGGNPGVQAFFGGGTVTCWGGT